MGTIRPVVRAGMGENVGRYSQGAVSRRWEIEADTKSGRTMSQYLAMDEPVMVNMDGQAYLIEP